MENIEKQILKKFSKDFDINFSGIKTCSSWIRVGPQSMKTIKKAIAILDSYNESILNCDTKKELSEFIDIEKIYSHYGGME